MRGKGRAKRGQRKEQFLAAVKRTPGATAAVIAKEIGVSASQAYGLARRLQKDGAIMRSGKGYKAADAKARTTA
jgi:DNA-binding IclR family transcriptional regulator